jgi:acetyl-CoA carboxylase biotin carboxyl carrier protein
MDIKELERVVEILKKSDITEFELEQEGVRIKLTRGYPLEQPRSATTLTTYSVETTRSDLPHVVDTTSQAIESGFKVESPIVGTFYRKPSPDAQAYVSEGSQVKKGQTIGIVEAMKLMNEIPAPCAGVVEQIIVGDGEVVEFGEVLMIIRPT